MANPAPPARRTGKPQQQRPHGRSLVDFGRLSPAEEKLRECCRMGDLASLGSERPSLEDNDRIVRAGFIRFLALGGDTDAPVHELGLQLEGAWISGELDLSSSKLEHPISLMQCTLEKLTANDATFASLNLAGSLLTEGIEGSRLRCQGDMTLSRGFESKATVALPAAFIGGDLYCSNASLRDRAGEALYCDGIVVEKDVVLMDGFSAKGTVRFVGARVGGDLLLTGGAFENLGKVALACDRISVGGTAFMREPFTANGAVRFLGANIGSNLDCSAAIFVSSAGPAMSADRATIKGTAFFTNARIYGEIRLNGASIGSNFECIGAKFDSQSDESIQCANITVAGDLFLNGDFEAKAAVMLDQATIKGSLLLANATFENPSGEAFSLEGASIYRSFFVAGSLDFKGTMNLTSLHAGAFCDDLSTWNTIGCPVILDGFTYDRLTGDACTDAEGREQWLMLQPQAHLGEANFRPQPWDQASSILKKMGHAEEARHLAVAKHKQMRKAGRYVGGSMAWDLVYGALVGYGYRPWKLLWIVTAVWVACAGVYSMAIRPQWLGSSAPLLAHSGSTLDISCLVERVSTRNAAPCPAPEPDYSSFFSLAYSAEVMLPVISLGSKADWRPILSTSEGRPLYWGWVVFLVYWLEIAFGWLAGLLLVGAIGNLVKKE